MPDKELIKFIRLSKGQHVIVDADMFEEINKFKWTKGSHGYATRGQWIPQEKYTRQVLMHRQIMRARPDQLVDHVDRDKTDCRLANMRLCNKSRNAANSKIRCDNTSGYRGVREHSPSRWVAKIQVNKKHIHIGLFDSKESAARAYDAAARKYFGEFARVNFQGEG